MDDKILYSRKESATKLGISVRSVDYIIADRKLVTRRIGRRVMVTRASLLKFASADHFEGVSK